jgi:prepilin-type N-terminal cleavage/methylation domain-containing protein
MTRLGKAHPVTLARRATARRLEGSDEGFTLIELLITVVIMPIVVGAITIALLSVFGLSDQTQKRVGDTNDAQIGSITFNKDVQSAENQETLTAPACGTSGQVQLLGLEWGTNTSAPGGYDTVVSYITSQTGKTISLVRQECQYANSTAPATFTSSPISIATISHDIGSPTLLITGGACEQPSSNPSGQLCPWTPTTDVTLIQFSVDEPGSNYSYTLAGLPGASVSEGNLQNVQPATNPAGCNFATFNQANPNTADVCFADFSSFRNSGPGAGCVGQATGQQMSLSIAGSGDTLSFCISATPYNEMSPYYIPTYYNPGANGFNSEAYLGNNGFFTGIPGKPALYQCNTADAPNIPTGCNGNGATNTVTITNITVTNSVGVTATGWTLVTGDAESTDANEWMVFTTSLSSGWDDLPNNGYSDLWGDACYDGPTTNPPEPGDPNANGALKWTGGAPTTATVGNPAAGPPATSSALNVSNTQNYPTNAASILCESDAQLNKTGTMMLAAPEANSTTPQSLTVTMKGAGLEGMFLGVLL